MQSASVTQRSRLESSNERTRLIPKGIAWPFALLTSLFAWWAVANNMTDTLLPAFKRILSLSDAKTANIQLVCYLFGYGCLAIPGAIFIRKYSYKAGVLLGLGLYVIGTFLFYPAGLTGNFYYFLAAIWILFSGLSILETAANPYIVAMGPEETATRRLNFAQAFNPLVEAESGDGPGTGPHESRAAEGHSVSGDRSHHRDLRDNWIDPCRHLAANCLQQKDADDGR